MLATQPDLVEHTVQLVLSLSNTLTIIAVNYEDEALRVLEVVPPERPDLRACQERSSPADSLPQFIDSYLVLATDVPHGEADVLVLDRLNIETCR